MIRSSSLCLSVLAVLLAACSSDDASPGGAADEAVNANQPAASGAGAGGAAGVAGAAGGNGPAATAGAPATNAAGGAESQDPDIGLSPGNGGAGGDGEGAGTDATDETPVAAGDAGAVPSGDTSLSFFVTSQNNTGDLGGLAGADAICQALAEAVGSGRTWAAYLSADDGGGGQPVNARDRIGVGPWFNAAGVQLAADLDALHALPSGDPALFLDENGGRINGQWAGSPTPNQHDVMTGSNADGTLLAGTTCNNWTSAAADIGGPRLGHADGLGPGMNGAPPFNSWNSSHTAPNCSAAGLQQVGGAGKLYCFASD